jgi:hypothetical protein
VLVVTLLALVAGALVYQVLVIVAAIRYRAVRPPGLAVGPPISILKPLAGAEEGLEENLRSFFEQRYPAFEILFAVRSSADPAISIVERLQALYPGVPSRLIVTGEPPYANAKVYSLDLMLEAASHDLVVMADSDIRVKPDMLDAFAGEFADQRLGMATCPYRVVPGDSIWSTLEALGLNTEFLSGVLVARMLDGMKFALGPTIAARRETLRGLRAREPGGTARIPGDPLFVRDRSSHRRTVIRREFAAPSPLDAQFPALAAVGLPGADFHPSAAAGTAGLRDRLHLVAGAGSRGTVAGGRRWRHRGARAAGLVDGPAVVADSGAGRRQHAGVVRRLLRKYHPVAGTAVLAAARRPVRVSAVNRVIAA